MVLMNRHSRHQPQSTKQMNDAIDRRLRDGEDDPSTRSQECAARCRCPDLSTVIKVLEHREHRDRIEQLGRLEVIREPSFDIADPVCGVGGVEIRIDAYATGDATAHQPEQRAVGAANVEDSGALWKIRRRLLDTPTLEHAIECFQVARA